RQRAAGSAVEVVRDLIMGTLAKEVVLAHGRGHAIRETINSAAEAILRFDYLLSSRAESARTIPFRATPRSIQDLWRSGNPALIVALQQFQTRMGSIDLSDAVQLSAHPLMGITSVIERPNRSRRLVIRAVSPLMRFYSERQRPAMEGADMRESPSREYSRW